MNWSMNRLHLEIGRIAPSQCRLARDAAARATTCWCGWESERQTKMGTHPAGRTNVIGKSSRPLTRDLEFSAIHAAHCPVTLEGIPVK